MPAERILIIGDDGEVRDFLQLVLREEGYEVETVPQGSAALNFITEFQPRLIVLDVLSPLISALQVSQGYQQHATPQVPIVVTSAEGYLACKATTPTAYGYNAKPFDTSDFLNIVVNSVSG